MPALVSYWEGAILHFPLNQYTTTRVLKHFNINVPEDPAERRFLVGALSQIQIYENLYYRHAKGFFPEDLWDGWERSMRNSFKTDPFCRIWEDSDVKEFLWKPFVDYVDGKCFDRRV